MNVSPFQVVDAKGMAGLVRDTHFHALYETTPQFAGKVMNKMLSNTYGNNIEAYLDKLPSETFEYDDDYFWKLQGDHNRNIPLISASWKGSAVTANTAGVGANRGQFQLVFPEKWFDEGHIIVGEKNEIYPIYVEAIEKTGQEEWTYHCVSALASPDGIPGEELVSGKLFSIEFSPVESTMSIRGTGIRRTTPIEFRNGFTTVRKENTIPGNMKSRKLATGFPNPNGGKPIVSWIEYEDFILEYEFMEEKVRGMYYGRTNRDAQGRSYMLGPSQNEIKIGAGLREMMEMANTFYYSTFSLKTLEDALLTLCEGKLGRDQRVFMIRTGERGAKQFSEQARAEATAWTPIFDQTSIRKVASNLHSQARTGGFQFTEWEFSNSIRVIIEVDSSYSDQVRNKIPHPDGGKAESYRYDIFDIGTVQGLPNMQKAYVKGSEYIRGIEEGLRSPFSADSGTNYNKMANRKDAWTLTLFSQFGVILRDAEHTMSLIPNVLAA
jgi:hypothetical protein